MPTVTKKSQYRLVMRSTYEDTRNPGVTSNYFPPVDNQNDICSGFVTAVRSSDPNWRVKIANKTNASLPYKRTTSGAVVPLLTCETETNGVGWRITGRSSSRYLGPTLTNFPSSDSTVADIALSRLKKKIASHRGDMNAMIPLAELRELRSTISGVADLASDLLNTLITIRRTKGRSAFKYASQAWLTYGFGISPLVADAKAGAQSISDFLLRTDHVARLTGEASRDWFSRLVETDYTSTYGANIDATANIHHKLSYRYTGAFNFNLKSSTDYGALQHFQVGLPALVPLFWELTAFSWVVDYFSTVGDFLEDVFVLTPTTSLYLNETRLYRAESLTSLKHKPVGNSKIVTCRDGQASWYYSEFERSVLSTLPHRVLRIKTLDEVGGKALNKMLNLASVFISMKR